MPDGLVGLRYCLEFLFRSFLNIFTEGRNLIRMIFDSHLAVGLLYLVVGCAWADSKDSIVALTVAIAAAIITAAALTAAIAVIASELSKDGIYILFSKANIGTDYLNDVNLTLNQTVACSEFHEVVV